MHWIVIVQHRATHNMSQFVSRHLLDFLAYDDLIILAKLLAWDQTFDNRFYPYSLWYNFTRDAYWRIVIGCSSWGQILFLERNNEKLSKDILQIVTVQGWLYTSSIHHVKIQNDVCSLEDLLRFFLSASFLTVNCYAITQQFFLSKKSHKRSFSVETRTTELHLTKMSSIGRILFSISSFCVPWKSEFRKH